MSSSPLPAPEYWLGREVSGYLITEIIHVSETCILVRAEDPRLARSVAVKLYKTWATGSEGDGVDSRRRFIRQAKAASSLDHPNICSVFEIGETPEGHLFTVFPFYEGKNFRELIQSGQPLKLDEVLSAIAQTARGLDKAHQDGFVHGYLDPEQLMLTLDHQAKILDFGLTLLPTRLARSSEQEDHYLSPEQRRGESPSPRSDQWALAQIAHEMLKAATATAIPQAAREALERASAEEPDERFEDMESFARALVHGFQMKLLRQDGSTQAVTPVVDLSLSSRWRWVAPAAGLLLAVAMLSSGWRHLEKEQPPPRAQIEQPVQVSRQMGLEKAPKWMPDGQNIVYASDQDGDMDIWLRHVDDDRLTPLTSDHSGYDDHPAISPDGQWTAFVSDRQGGGIFLMPSRGGPARLVASVPLSPGHDSKVHAPTLAFTPDSKHLIFAGSRALPGLFEIDLTTQGPADIQTIPLVAPRDPFSLAELDISPDGERIVFAELTGTGTSVTRLWHVARDGSDPIRLTDGADFAHSPQWSEDGQAIYFISDRNGNRDIYKSHLDPRGRPKWQPQNVTSGLEIQTFDISPDGSRLIYTKITERANIRSLRISPSGDTGGQPTFQDHEQSQTLTSENHLIEFIDVSQDGRWLAFDSNRGGNVDIWLMRLLDRTLHQLTRDTAHDWRPRISPDGEKVVFYSLRDGDRNLWWIPFKGGPARRLTDRPGTDWMPNWSPDSKTVVFDADHQGTRSIWTVDLEGGDPVRITPTSDGDSMYPIYSSRGDEILYAKEHGDLSMGLYRIAVDGGAPQPILDRSWVAIFPLTWDDDGWIYGWGRRDGNESPSYWRIRSVGGRPLQIEPLVRLNHPNLELVEGFDVHQDTLFFPLWELRGDLWQATLADR